MGRGPKLAERRSADQVGLPLFGRAARLPTVSNPPFLPMGSKSGVRLVTRKGATEKTRTGPGKERPQRSMRAFPAQRMRWIFRAVRSKSRWLRALDLNLLAAG
jgi:hypothetical protein